MEERWKRDGREMEERWKREVAERYYLCYESGIGTGVRERGEVVKLANVASPCRAIGKRAMDEPGQFRAFAHRKSSSSIMTYYGECSRCYQR
jgi:hypothetical protein